MACGHCGIVTYQLRLFHFSTSNCSLTSAVGEMGDRLATIDMRRKVGGGCYAPFQGELDPDLTQCCLGRRSVELPFHAPCVRCRFSVCYFSCRCFVPFQLALL